jgi:hypothetical protein
MTETGNTADPYYSWKIFDDGVSLTPRIEYYDVSGCDVTPTPLYIPETNVVSTSVEKHKLK